MNNQQPSLVGPAEAAGSQQRPSILQRGTNLPSRTAYQLQTAPASSHQTTSNQSPQSNLQAQPQIIYQKRSVPEAYSSLSVHNGAPYQRITGLETSAASPIHQQQYPQATSIPGQQQHYQVYSSPVHQQCHVLAAHPGSVSPQQYKQDSHLEIHQQLHHRRELGRFKMDAGSSHTSPKQILQHPKSSGGCGSGTEPVGKSVENTSASNNTNVTVSLPARTAPITITSKALEDHPSLDHLKNEAEEKQANPEETEETSNASEKLDLANTKEKTPMCLVNELARYNKMSHQYILVDEQGPAHKKTFFVKLKLGEEEYSSSGESIKKAQHSAAAVALVDTKYRHPPPKTMRNRPVAEPPVPDDGHITPTVELNALAMKRGEAAVYKSIEPQQPPYYHQSGMALRGLYNQRYHQMMRGGRDPRYRGGGGVYWPMRHYPRVNRAFYVSLRVGHREFIGDGPTRQAARHNAAQKALRILKNLPASQQPENKETKDEQEEEGILDDSLKSEISLVHEIALRRTMSVIFEVVRETGPPHMKNFITRCTVGELKKEAEGNSKKTSKKRAAQMMLEELKKLPTLPPPAFPRARTKMQMNKKKNKNIIKSEIQQQKADPNYGVGINPISRLIQIMQAQKKKEPVYALVAERGLPRRREFIIQVEVGDKSCQGTGPNKKLAKRAAAELMLNLLGYTKPSPQPTKSSIKTHSSAESGVSNGDKKVTFVEVHAEPVAAEKQTSSNGQRVPGILHVPNAKSLSPNHTPRPSATPGTKESSAVNLANILKPSLRPEIQLTELCKLLGYTLEVDDFTKKRGDTVEHICRMKVGTDPPQNFHGSNSTLESSRDMAALDALKVLVTRAKDIHPGGDGPQLKKNLLTRSTLSSRKDISK